MLTVVISMYYFTFEFKALPGANTKLILAAVGLVILGYNISKNQMGAIHRDFLSLTLWASVFSLVCFASLAYNSVWDTAYATYFMTMWVWMGGAYAVITFIKALHGDVTVERIIYYLLAVCVMQCVIAQLISYWPEFANLVNTYIEQDERIARSDRLYGIGAALDTAGTRFAAVLVMTAALLVIRPFKTSKQLLLITVYFIIVVLGCMIGRTTTVGVALSIALYGTWIFFKRGAEKGYLYDILYKVFIVLLIVVPICVVMYNTDSIARHNIRFAFEGFFSLAEKGRWEVGSNELLEDMFIWPDNLKTWVIGDGYFNNPLNTDPYYTGKITKGLFYMRTDIGYCRFLLYCGLMGLLAFSAFLIKAGYICIQKHPRYTFMILFLLALNFVVWAKVSTDIFLVFALLLLADKEDERDTEEELRQTSNL